MHDRHGASIPHRARERDSASRSREREREQVTAANQCEFQRGPDWRVLLFLVLAVYVTCLSLTAQVVRLENLAPQTFSGWARTTVDRTTPHMVGTVGGCLFVVGRQVGRDTRVVDVRVNLPPGGTMSLDLAGSQPATFALGGLPASPVAFFGGWATVGATPLQIVALAPDGAGWLVHLRARPAPVGMLCVDLWLTWYPDRPGWARGEVLVTASNPAVPAMSATIPPDFSLRFGSAIVSVPSGPGPLLAPGTVLADGQARALPVVFCWPQHLQGLGDFGSVLADAQLAVVGVGVSRLLADGNPTYPAGFDPRAWARPLLPEAFRRLHTWEWPVCGPSIRSADTGAQEDQMVHPGGEALTCPPALLVRYLSAIKLHGERPCNHLEADGSQLDPARHPQLLFWDSRAFTITSVSPDQLGKPRALTEAETQGRWGADTQHFLANTLTASARLTGSPLCQHLMHSMATAYLLQRTANPSQSTSAIFSARELGYEGVWVVHCHFNLEDRGLAARVVQRWRDRVAAILLPRIPGDVCKVFDSDARLGLGPWAIAWQESLGAYGIDLACRIVGPVEGRAIALRVAKRMLQDGWAQSGTDWLTRPQFPLAVGATMPAPDGSFNRFGMPLCAAVVLMHEPTNTRARAVWNYLLADPNGSRRWMPPGVQ